MRYYSFIVALLFLVVGFASCNKGGDEQVSDVPVKEKVIKYGLPIEDFIVVCDTLRQNETLTDMLMRLGFSVSDVYKMTDGFYYSVSEKEREGFCKPEGWELVQVFDEKTASNICEEISLQFEDAFKWMSGLEYEFLK